MKLAQKLGLVAVVLWGVTIAILGYFYLHGWTSESAGKRTAVHLTPAERDVVLAEMRQMLHSVHGLLTGLSAGDAKIMEAAARASGMAMAADINPALMAKLPMEFKRQGMSVHSDFDMLAVHIAQGASHEAILREFTGITARCVGCHSLYRLP